MDEQTYKAYLLNNYILGVFVFLFFFMGDIKIFYLGSYTGSVQYLLQAGLCPFCFLNCVH